MLARPEADGARQDPQEEDATAAHIHFDRNALRAARSLERNRRLVLVAQDRIDRASTALRAYLYQIGASRADIGLYTVESIAGVVRVSRRPRPDSRQLRLWLSDDSPDRA